MNETLKSIYSKDLDTPPTIRFSELYNSYPQEPKMKKIYIQNSEVIWLIELDRIFGGRY